MRHIATAKVEMNEVLDRLGMKHIGLPDDATPSGGLETVADGLKYAEFLKAHADEVAGIIVCLPNFGEEAPIYHAIKNSGVDVPVLVQAVDDDDDKLSLEWRRDAFCGKLCVTNNLYYGGIKFTNTTLHTCKIDSPEFIADLKRFARVCDVVNSMRNATVGLIGARPDPFRTVRFSEKMLQLRGITTRVVDLSVIIADAKSFDDQAVIAEWEKKIRAYGKIDSTKWSASLITSQAKLIAVVKRWLVENNCDCFAMQCWDSIEYNYGTAACLVMSMMGEEGIPGACECDIMGALSMLALNRASGNLSAYMDWNNNFSDDRNVCICQHCGNFPKSFFNTEISIDNLDVLGTVIGNERCFGACKGQATPGPMTTCKIACDDINGKIKAYFSEGDLLADKIQSFGALSLWKLPRMQELLNYLCKNGFEHHTAVVRDHVADILEEALGNYLDIEVYNHK